MSAAHFFYIPAVVLVGIVVGFLLGARATRDAYEAERRRREAREKRGGA